MAAVVPNYSSVAKRRIWLPNRKWTVRLSIFVGCGIILYFGTLLLLTLLSSRRFWADVASRRGRGEKVLKEDFVQPPIPQSSNAAYYINKAGAAIQLTDDDWGFLDQLSRDGTLSPADLKRLQGILQRNRAVLENVHAARSCSQTDWQLDYSGSPLTMTMSLRFLEPLREIAKLLARDVQANHLIGDDAGAVETLEDLLALSRSLDSQCVEVSRLVSLAISSLAIDACQGITSGLRVSNNGGAGHDATPEQVEHLMGRLLDDAAQQAAIHQAWRGERMELIDDALFIAHATSIFHRAIFYNDADWSFRGTDLMLSAINAPSWGACAAIIHNSPGPSPSTHFLAVMLAPSWRYEAIPEFHARAERRATAILLAIRLYSVQHGGRLPPSLQALVPAYLRSLPADPYSSKGGAFQYRSTAPAAVYSVGEDGVDDGGKIPGPNDYRWTQPDAVFPIEPPINPGKQKD